MSTHSTFERRVSDFQHDPAAVSLHLDALERSAKERAGARERLRDPKSLRAAASAIRAADVRRMDSLLEDFCSRFEKAGGRVHWAPDAHEAREALAMIVRQAGVKKAVKARSATLVEIEAERILARERVAVTRTEFGDHVLGLSGDSPTHPVHVAAHLSKDRMAAILHDRGGEPVARSPEEFAEVMKRRLRPALQEADLGLLGANFLLADSGHVVLAESQGNLRLGAVLPRVVVVVAGIDKVTAMADNLPVLLAALSTAGGGRTMPPSVTLFSPDASRCCDAPGREVHLILVDNGRAARLANPAKAETLRCIGCGACSDVCPVYRLGGGGVFGMRSPGPFGLATELRATDPHARRQLALATPLCGACVEACPVGIDLHGALAATRAEPGQVIPGRRLRLLLSLYLWSVTTPGRFAFGARLMKGFMVLSDFVRDTPLNPLAGWARHRTLPESPERTFREWWNQTGGAASPGARQE